MNPLPSLRKRIFRAFSWVVALYAILGVLLVLTVLIASRNTPKAIHRNYDSIAAIDQMQNAWNALRRPGDYQGKSQAEWRDVFERALKFEERNVTERGEGTAVEEVKKLWLANGDRVQGIDTDSFARMTELLSQITSINEQGMFSLAQQNTRLSQWVLVGGVIYFVITLILSLFFADRLSNRLAEPLKSISEALHSRRSFDRKLRLPDPTSLEVLILTQELTRLWERVMETEKLNVNQLVQEKRRLETVLESVEDALLVVDSSGRVTHCNSVLLELISLKPEQVIGQSWADLPSNHENYLKLRKTLAEDLSNGADIALGLAGKQLHFAARRREIEGPGRVVAATLFLLHDITEKKQRDRLRAEIIDLLSHELKTPLQSLGTASEILSGHRDTLSDDLRLMVDTIHEDVERLRAVASEFVTMTESQSKVLKLRMERVPINELIGDWLKPFRVVARDRGVHLEFLIEGSERIWARIDPVKFPWVISNLVSNAIRYSPSGATVTVLVTDRNGATEIKVMDEGPGIAPGDRERIFEPFFQAVVQKASGGRGLFGIGLTIAREVVEAHDGRIEYHPREPRGSVFRILLPLPELTIG